MDNPYNTTEGDKQQCRQDFVDMAKQYTPEAKQFFLLPSMNGYDAKLVQEEFDTPNIIGVERENNTFKKMYRDNITTLNCDVTDFINYNLPLSHFDAVWLDFLGSCTKSNVADICNFVESDYIQKGKKTVLAFTVSALARSMTDEVYELCSKNPSYDNLNPTEKDIANMVGYHLELGFNFENRKGLPLGNSITVTKLISKKYQCNDDSLPMYFIVFLIEKY